MSYSNVEVRINAQVIIKKRKFEVSRVIIQGDGKIEDDVTYYIVA